MKRQLLDFWSKNLYENWKWLSPSLLAIFWRIFLLIVLKHNPVDTCDNFSWQLTEACHILYNVQSDNKYEHGLKDWGWDDYHLFPGQGY